MKENIPYDQIEEYLSGRMEKEALLAFEENLSKDEALSQELALYRKIRTANQDKGLTDLELKLEKAYAENIQSDKKTNGKIWLWIVGVIVLIALFFVLKKSIAEPPPVEPERIYAQFAQHDFSFQEMSTENSLSELETLLKSSQYAEALPLLNTYLAEHPDALDVYLAKGISLLETGQINAAIDVFTDLKTRSPLYQSETNWYTALAYLKQGQLAESLDHLREIPESSSRYNKARELLQMLEKQ